MAKPIIGLDFGNYNSFPCFISDFDEGTRLGGTVHNLTPNGLNNGIPSVFFYSKNRGILCGEEAVRSSAKPIDNRIRYLKRNLGNIIYFKDGSPSIPYDVAVTKVIEHCVRRANEQLKSGFQLTTNLISLSYPATYSFAQLQRLIELAEQATLEDGTRVKVFGTIPEPAAAALDYLAESSEDTKEKTVLVYDLGGGTFDLALVSAYPGGRKTDDGDIYYYDIIDTTGIPNIGGVEFDERMFNLLEKKFNVPLKPVHKSVLKDRAESVKRDLSDDIYAQTEILYNDEFVQVDVSRSEFEAATRDLLMKTIEKTKEILDSHPNQQPDMILLCGGASEMPMVMNEIQKQIPKFRDKVIKFRPSYAIAYGAARFGTVESNTEPTKAGPIILRTRYDIGVKFFRDLNDKIGYICTYIKAGTKLPFEGEFSKSFTLSNQRYSDFTIFEANKSNPDKTKPNEDYREIMTLLFDHKREVPKGTESETKINVTRLGVLDIEAREVENHNLNLKSGPVQLKNLSSN